ncbi:imidazole glycerol phosphate synthase subunit HisH [Pedobacter caeni]|uniref:Imidazole glycerol phosphate synthase subunit HisH n=1 Tax=Pedobacter caeni TaxID=288992 RepID=A0A1M5PQC5_9SPHI|nr:imidazole glycerol phosphate synthase subunit HisH [Pedobacter caeni]SHH03974.1 glutamine amidotransferase [Pedobacter caeni]
MINNNLKKVTIIDYHLGNLFSVKQACDTVGINAIISSKAEDIENADALILPGVGAFIEAMDNLADLNLIETIKKAAAEKKPIFGICLGLQLLFTKSEEFGTGEGLDLVPGTIRKFPADLDDRKVKVPQIAWNSIYEFEKKWSDTPLMDVVNNEFMYFVHSYYVDPSNDMDILTKTNYDGIEYCSAISKDNIFATQFHPEKSTLKGLSIYKNWATLNNLI